MKAIVRSHLIERLVEYIGVLKNVTLCSILLPKLVLEQVGDESLI